MSGYINCGRLCSSCTPHFPRERVLADFQTRLKAPAAYEEVDRDVMNLFSDRIECLGLRTLVLLPANSAIFSRKDVDRWFEGAEEMWFQLQHFFDKIAK